MNLNQWTALILLIAAFRGTVGQKGSYNNFLATSILAAIVKM
jgi:hypothetical protein